MSLRAARSGPNPICTAGLLLSRVEAFGRSAGGTLLDVPSDLVEDFYNIVQLIANSCNFTTIPNLDEELERQRPGFWAQAMAVHFWAARDMLGLLEIPSSRERALMLKKFASLTCTTPWLLTASNALLPPSKFRDRLLHAVMRADTFACYSAILAHIRGVQHVTPSEFEWMLTTVVMLVTVVSQTSRCVSGRSIEDQRIVGAFNPAWYRDWVDCLTDSHLLEHAAGAILRMQNAARTALEGGNCDIVLTRERLNSLCGHFGQIVHRVIEPFLGEPINSLCPRPLAEADLSTNGAMREMLPMLRTLLSGTSVQFWLGWELIQLRLAVSGGVGPTHGLQAESFLPPQLLAPASPLTGLSDRSSCALGLLLMHINVCTTVWQLTVSGPRPPARRPALFGGLIPDPAAVVVLAPSLPYTATQVYELSHEALWCVAQKASELTRAASFAFTEMTNMAKMLVRLISELRPRIAAPRVPPLWRTIARILEAVPLASANLNSGLLRSIRLLLQMNEPVEEAGGPGQVPGGAPGQGGGDAPAGGGGGAGHGAERGPAVGLHGALVSGFLPSLECAFRCDVRDIGGCGSALSMLSLLLRSSGVWPAVLAHGSIREVASLVITLRKISEAVATEGTLGFLPGVSVHMLTPLISQWTSNLVAMLEQVVVMMLPPLPRATAGAPNSATSVPGGSGASKSAAASRSSQSRSREAVGGPLLPLNNVMEYNPEGGLRIDWLVHVGGRPTRGSAAAAQQQLLAVFALMQWLPAAQRGMHLPWWWGGEAKLAIAKMVLVAAVQCLKARRRHELSKGGGGVGSGSSKATGKSTSTTSGRDNQAWTAAAAGTSTNANTSPNATAAGGGKVQSSAVEGQGPGAKDLHAFLSWRKFLTKDIGVVAWLGSVLGVSFVKDGQDKEKDGALVCCALDVLEVLVVSMPEDVRDRVTVVAAAATAAGGSSTGPGRAGKKDKKKDKAKANNAKDKAVGKGKTAAAGSEGATAAVAADGGGGGVAVLSEKLLRAYGRGTLLRALQALRPIPMVDLSSAGPSTPSTSSTAPAFPASASASSLSSTDGSSTRTGGAGGACPFAGGHLSVTPELAAHVGALWLEASARLAPDEVPDLPAPVEVLDAVAAAGVRPCGNTACHNLELPQEARLKAKRCSRCKAVWYCCSECQKAHWRAGHKEACVTVEE